MNNQNLNNTGLFSPENTSLPAAGSPVQPPAGHAPPLERDLRDIMGNAREIVLIHNSERYHLRITARGKLILTK